MDKGRLEFLLRTMGSDENGSAAWSVLPAEIATFITSGCDECTCDLFIIGCPLSMRRSPLPAGLRIHVVL